MSIAAETLTALAKINARLDALEETNRQAQEMIAVMKAMAEKFAPLLEQFAPMLASFAPMISGMVSIQVGGEEETIKFLGNGSTGS